jgi:hypothetical protein
MGQAGLTMMEQVKANNKRPAKKKNQRYLIFITCKTDFIQDKKECAR